jgi:hypothetical protein
MRAGQSLVVLDSVILASTDGEPLPFAVENGEVNVAGEAGPTAMPSAPIATETAPPAAPATKTEPAPTVAQTMAQTPGGTPDGLSPTGTGPASTATATAGGEHATVTGTPVIEPSGTEGAILAPSATLATPTATPRASDLPAGTLGPTTVGAAVPPPTRTALPAPTIADSQPNGGERARSGLAAGWLWAAALLVLAAIALTASYVVKRRDPGAGD